ncbi:MAG: hypothetical protein VB064_04910, partial [Oscillospiraceae bacterium]|nr:hypothetical protein [Oscillospiraceae bacterium]
METLIMYFSNVNLIKMLFKDPELFWHYIFKSGKITAFKKFHPTTTVMTRTEYAGRELLSIEKANVYLAKKINERSPFMAARIGGTEMGCMTNTILQNQGYIKSIDFNAYEKGNHANGLFPLNQSTFNGFNSIMNSATEECDLVGAVYWILEEYHFKKHLYDGAVISHVRVFDFWRFEHPWTGALKGKKVLVIHPFEETIRSQYQKRAHLFANPEMLPEFQLYTIKAVQTIAGQKDDRFANWFEALDYMYDEAMRIDFDVALIGCGAYGY